MVTGRSRSKQRASLFKACIAAGAMLALAGTAFAQNTRGSMTGPTTAKGYDHPGQYITIQDVKPAPNMYPAVQHADQDRAARDKLAALEKKTGKKPNVLIFLMDDVASPDRSRSQSSSRRRAT